MKTLVLTLCLVCLKFALFSQQISNGLTASNGQFIGFLEFKPYNYNSNTAKYPLIIFLHGVGERGNGTTDLYKVAWNAIPKYCANGATMTFNYNGQDQSFMVLSPQLGSSYGQWENFYVEEMIKYAKQSLRVDPARIYLCGLSLGGGGVWKYASGSSANATGLAAIAPVCATNDGNTYCNIAQANLPVWAFHAEDDGTVGVGNTRYVVGQINGCNPGVVPRTTYYPNGGHGIWDRAFDMGHTWQSPENMYEWFLSKSRGTPAVPPPPPANQPPVAYAGADISITLPQSSATLSGAGSADADGTIASYSWTKINGPASYSIASPGGVSTSITNLVQGTYTFRLTVTDNSGASASDDVVIVVNNAVAVNQVPVAKAGADAAITLPVNSQTIDGSGSSDPDGTIAAYAWSKVGGPASYSIASPNNASTSITNLVQGTYTFRLTVTDNTGATASDDMLIVVNNAPPVSNQPPVANAGADITISSPANSAALSGAASSDPDGTITTYAWSQVGGPSPSTIANASAANTTINNLSQGTYYFQLIVGDNAGGASTDLVIVNVNASSNVNQPPIANAGADITISLPGTVTLNGSASSDPDGTIVSYAWSQVGGPSASTIANTNSVNTTVSNLAEGTYYYQLVVGDNSGGATTDLVIVTVNATAPKTNQAPVARAGSDVTIILPANSTALNGTASSDPDGTITGWSWSKLNGPASYSIASPSNANTQITSLAQGVYTFRLTVTDNSGASATDDVVITVNANNAINQKPVSNAGADVVLTLPVNSGMLNGSASYDPDGSISYYGWSRISGPASYTIENPFGKSTALTNLVQGTYAFLLVVTDNKGDIAKDTVVFEVKTAVAGNQAPIARAGADITIVFPTISTVLNGSGSSDNDGTVTAWSWSKLSGPASYSITSPAAANTGINSLAEGTYTFRLTVTDNNGATASDDVVVTVNPANGINQLPVANAGPDVVITLPGNSGVLDATRSFDPDGSISYYGWSRISGPVQHSIDNPWGRTTALTNLIQGTYSFLLVVTDNKGDIAKDTVVFTVNAVGGLAAQKNQNATGLNSITSAIPETAKAANGTIAEAQLKLNLFPNPATSQLNIEIQQGAMGKIGLFITDASGRAISAQYLAKEQATIIKTININNLRPGMYYVSIQQADGTKSVRAFIKQ